MKRKQLTVLALAAMLAVGMASAADFSSWQKKMKVTCDWALFACRQAGATGHSK
jgi:hypothetical protein